MSKPERVLHDHGALEIVTVKPPHDDRWEIVAAHLSGFVGPVDFRQGTVKELYTQDTFESDNAAIDFASKRLGVDLRTNGRDHKFRLHDTGFRNQCTLERIS